MRELILFAAILIAVGGVADAVRWRRRTARVREELRQVFRAARSEGIPEFVLVRLVTKAMADHGRAPFEVLRILAGRAVR